MRAVSLTFTEMAPLSGEVLRRGGSLRFEAHGSSMFPFIRDGDVLTAKPESAEALRAGDVALYHTACGRLAAHRVVSRKIQHDQVVLALRGDAACGASELVPAKQVLGKIVCVQRGARIIHLDRKSHKILARLWIGLSPLRIPWWIQRGKYTALWFLHCLQGVKLYRAAARKVIGNRVNYQVASIGKVPDLAKLYGYYRLPNMEDPIASLTAQMANIQDCGYTLIASAGQLILGASFIMHFPENDSLYPGWWLFGMLVRRRYRGAGIGEGLTCLALEKAAKEGAARINLLVFQQNMAAARLYSKMGFHPTSIPALDEHLEDKVKRGEKRSIIMCRPLETKKGLCQ